MGNVSSRASTAICLFLPLKNLAVKIKFAKKLKGPKRHLTLKLSPLFTRIDLKEAKKCSFRKSLHEFPVFHRGNFREEIIERDQTQKKNRNPDDGRVHPAIRNRQIFQRGRREGGHRTHCFFYPIKNRGIFRRYPRKKTEQCTLLRKDEAGPRAACESLGLREVKHRP